MTRPPYIGLPPTCPWLTSACSCPSCHHLCFCSGSQSSCACQERTKLSPCCHCTQSGWQLLDQSPWLFQSGQRDGPGCLLCAMPPRKCKVHCSRQILELTPATSRTCCALPSSIQLADLGACCVR